MSTDGQNFLNLVRPALEACDPPRLAEVVGEHWSLPQVCTLLADPDVDVRRVAAVVLGLVGDAGTTGCLIRALRDGDGQVNEMAEHSLWSIWFRSGSARAARPFREGVAMLGAESYEKAIDCFKEATQIDPNFAEAYNQCGIAYFFAGDWKAAIESCRRAIECMPGHFGAICGMGHCYTQTGDLIRAQKCYQRALKINPHMPAIERAVARIDMRLRELNDSSGTFTANHIPV